MIGKTNALSGATVSTGTLEVKYWDVDGTELKNQFINSGENATPPDDPQYDSELSFYGWNQSSNGLKYPADIGATYTCSYLTFYIEINENSGYQPTIYLNKRDTTLLTIEWGDGTTNTSSASGTVSITKTSVYPSNGIFKIRLVSNVNSIENVQYQSYFNNSNYDKWVKKILIGNNIYKINSNCFTQSQYIRLEVFVPNASKLPADHPLSFIQSLNCLKAIIIPNQIWNTSTLFANSCASAIVFSIPNNGSAIGSVVSSCSMLRRVIFPPLNTYNSNSNINGCVALEYAWISTNSIIAYFASNAYSLKKIDGVNFTALTSIGAGAFSYCYQLEIPEINLSSCPDVPTSVIANTYRIKKIVLPNAMTTTSLGNQFCYSTMIDELILPTNSVSLSALNCIAQNKVLKKLDCQFVSSIAASAITNNSALKTIIFRNTNPPTNMFLGTIGLNSFTNIYVPDDQVSIYKTLANLSTYASQILPLSLLSN